MAQQRAKGQSSTNRNSRSIISFRNYQTCFFFNLVATAQTAAAKGRDESTAANRVTCLRINIKYLRAKPEELPQGRPHRLRGAKPTPAPAPAAAVAAASVIGKRHEVHHRRRDYAAGIVGRRVRQGIEHPGQLQYSRSVRARRLGHRRWYIVKAGEGGAYTGGRHHRPGRKETREFVRSGTQAIIDSSAEWVHFCLFRSWIEVGS